MPPTASCCVRRRGFITISRRCCVFACRGGSIRWSRARRSWPCSLARAVFPIFRRWRRILRTCRRACGACSMKSSAERRERLRLLRGLDRDLAGVGGQAQDYGRAHPFDRADFHRAPVQLDQRFGDREPESGTLEGLGELAFDLLEGTAELFQV